MELKLQARKLKKLLGLNIVSKGAKMPEEILGGKLRKKILPYPLQKVAQVDSSHIKLQPFPVHRNILRVVLFHMTVS